MHYAPTYYRPLPQRRQIAAGWPLSLIGAFALLVVGFCWLSRTITASSMGRSFTCGNGWSPETVTGADRYDPTGQAFGSACDAAINNTYSISFVFFLASLMAFFIIGIVYAVRRSQRQPQW